MTIIDEQEFANEAFKLLESIAHEIGREDFSTNDITSYGRGERYYHQHLQYLLDQGHIIERSSDCYAITEQAFTLLS